MDDIARIRNRIDEIDEEIVRLLKNRYENARLLGRIKEHRDLEYRDPEREKIILGKVERAATSMGLEPKLIRSIFDQIFAFSVQAQKDQSKPSSRGLQRMRILVVGGTGGMGRLFARFASMHGGEVKIAGREIIKTRKAAEELGVETGTILDAATSDMVILAVPMEETVRVATETLSIINGGALLTDLSSVKTGISDKISKRIPKGLEFVSLHPLFGPSVDHLHDQAIVAVPYQPGQKWSKLTRAFEGAGAKIHTMRADKHDQAMAYIQGLHHFALLCLGLGIDGMGGEPRTQSLQESEKRIASLLDNWETILGIQLMNPFVPPVRQKFLEIATNLAGLRSKQGPGLRKKLASNVQKWSRKL